MTLSRCGRQYETMADAYCAAEKRQQRGGGKWVVVSCAFCEFWHVVRPSSVTAAAARLDPFPPAVRTQLVTRDECCQRCGFTGRLEAHHRRAKSSGGSKARSHTQCACNGVMLCRRCHEWAHMNPRKARIEGWIVSQSIALPGWVAMEALTGPGLRIGNYPSCEGRWRPLSD